MLLPKQLDMISYEYYVKGFLLGRNKLYNHMKNKYPGMFDSRDDVGEWLKHQEVSQLFQYQRKPRVVSSMIPQRPFHSLSLDLIDKSKKPSGPYKYILVIIENFNRYLFCYPLKSKKTKETSRALKEFFKYLDEEWYVGKNDIKFIRMDIGGEFKKEFADVLKERSIYISHTIPHMPQPNSIVERANGVIKRFINTLIFVRANEDYSKWAEYLEEAVDIYNHTVNSSTGYTPDEAVMFYEDNMVKDVVENISDKSVKPAPFQNSFKQGQRVRLRIPKGNMGKFDKRNWTEQIFEITEVIFPTDTELKKAAAKPTRYKIRPIDMKGNYVGKEQSPLYVKESILAIPPLLGYNKKEKAPKLKPRPQLEGYRINPPQPYFEIDEVGLQNLANLWKNHHVNGHSPPEDVIKN